MYNEQVKKKVKTLESDKYLIPRGATFLQRVEEYFSDKRFKETQDQLNMRTYTAGNTGITYRVINHWDKSGLLPPGLKDKSGWRKFTLVELVWLKAIQRFREYGFPLDKIARVKKTVIEWNKSEEIYPIFEYYVARACQSKDDIFIVALVDGTAGIASSEDIEIMKLSHHKTNDMLLISLKSIVNELGIKVPNARPLKKLSDSEGEVLDEIRREGNKEVFVGINGGSIKDIVTTQVYGNIESTTLSEIKNQLKAQQGFADVSVRYENGKAQSVGVKRRKRLK